MQACQNLCWKIFRRLRANTLLTKTASKKQIFAIALVILVLFVVFMYATKTKADPKAGIQKLLTGADQTNTRIKHRILKIRRSLGEVPGEIKPPPKTENLYEAGFNISAGNVCALKGKNIKMMVMVISGPGNEEQRDIIRKTWGTVARRSDTALAFLVGMSSNTSTLAKVKTESDTYGDIIRGNFVDTYFTLTLKTISMLEWTLTYCKQTKLLFKVDDDLFINFPKLFEILDTRLLKLSRNIIGLVVKNGKPDRDRESKYYLSKGQYPGKSFPDYSAGPAYIITADAIRDLYAVSLKGGFLAWEDVYVTGVVAGQLGIKNIHVKEFYNNRHDNLTSCFAADNVSIHKLQKEEMFSLWSELSNGKLNCT